MATVTILAAFASDMLIYDEGNVYSCPVDHLNGKMAGHLGKDLNDDEGKAYQIDPISHKKFEDMFYDPVACRPFYQDKEAPIWYGRVENMQPVNQKIYVYGFVTTPIDGTNQ